MLLEKYGKKDKTMIDFLCDEYHNVAQYDSKQFIYIIRLDKKLTPASPILPYPKPSTEYPIQTKRQVYQIDKNFVVPDDKPEIKEFYYTPGESLFTRAYNVRHGIQQTYVPKIQVVVYNKEGKFI